MPRKLRKRIRRALLIATLGVVILGLAAPRFSADPFKKRIQASLERALGRAVEIGDVRYNLFTGPGFTLNRVTIHDEPGAGIEPLAYVESLEARIRVSGLWTGHLEFSNLRLEDTSVNLVKTPEGSWNLQALLKGSIAPADAKASSFPAIQVRSARLNFKFGARKSIFYFAKSDADVYQASAGRLGVRFSGEPARTDRSAQGFGRLTGGATWNSGRLDMDLQLERSALDEMAALFEGHDIGVHGTVASRAHVSGPVANLQVLGDVTVEDIHRWDQIPAKGAQWRASYRGSLDLASARLDLETVPPSTGPAPLSVKLHSADYLSAPKWGVVATLNEAPADSLIELARHMGASLAPQVALEGKLVGVIGYTRSGGLQGQIAIREASLETPESHKIRAKSAQVSIDNGNLHLEPSTIEGEHGQSGEIEANYLAKEQSFDFRVGTRALDIAEFQSGAEKLAVAHSAPLLEICKRGTWKGWLSYHQSAKNPGTWTGDLELHDTTIDLPGFAEPLKVATSAVSIEGEKLIVSRLRGEMGQVEITGDYRFEPALSRPHRVRLNIAELDLNELERLLAPTLRSQQGFIERTLRLSRRTPPAWLASRRMDGQLHVESLSSRDIDLGDLRCRLVWDGTNVQLLSVQLSNEDTVATGRLVATLTNAMPQYRMTGQIRNFNWRSGKIDLEGRLDTFGTGQDLLLHARSEGSFTGKGIEFSPEYDFRTASGQYDFSMEQGWLSLRLSALQLFEGSENLVGQGASEKDGRLMLDVSNGRRQLRLIGTLLPPAEPVAR